PRRPSCQKRTLRPITSPRTRPLRNFSTRRENRRRLVADVQSSPPIKIGLVSLGCAKNLVDSEVMLGSLLRDGMQLTERAEEADVVIVNTCGFIEASKQESINAILKANQLRRTGNCKALI